MVRKWQEQRTAEFDLDEDAFDSVAFMTSCTRLRGNFKNAIVARVEATTRSFLDVVWVRSAFGTKHVRQSAGLQLIQPSFGL